ncbi:MAG: hypothetical protein KGD67_00835 [Candidatus Lokiarchaeota archaeon]|nr:hypothetical protein [Candidatus Lokiarchaeota archaeon]
MEDEDNIYKMLKCEYCGYLFVAPYQKDCICRNCNLFSVKIFRFMYGKYNFFNKDGPKELKIVSNRNIRRTEKKKIPKVEPKELKILSNRNISRIEKKKIPKHKFFYGIVSKERIPIYYNDKKCKYILELTNNLDFISMSTLSGKLDKMLIILSSEDAAVEKKLNARFFDKKGVIHILIGNFSDKKSDWIFNQVSMFFNDILQKDKINIKKLDKSKKREISFKMNIYLNYIEEAVDLKVKFEKPNFDYLDNWLRLDYFGVSAETVGVLSLLWDQEDILKFRKQKQFKFDSENDISKEEREEKENEIMDFTESVLTAKIEATIAIIIANMKGYPRWISIKSGFQKYRFLSFKKLENQFFLYSITEGNIEKLKSLESFLVMHLKDGIEKKFTSSLKTFNEMKIKIRDIVETIPERKFY